MKNYKRMRLAAPVIVLAVGSMLAGCNNSTETPVSSQKPSSTTTANTPVKFTIMANLQTTEVPSDKLEKFIEEKTNSQIEIQWVPDGSYDEKFQAALATGALPQAAFIKNAASFVLMRDAIKNGQFWEIGPYLQDYPNLSKLDPKILQNTKVNGKIYSLYQERQPARSGLVFRKDWLDQVGMAVPTTTDEIYQVLKKFKEADLAGGGKTIPLADRNDLVYGSFKTIATLFGTPNGWGVVDGKLVPEFMTKGYMDTLNFYKKLYDEGLINKDFPVTSKNDQENLLFTNRSGMLVGNMTGTKALQDKTVINFPETVFDVSNDLKGPDGKNVTWGASGYGTILLFPKASVKTEAELKSILGVFDKFFDKELANTLKYGLKDENHHTLDADGKIIPSTDSKLIDKDVRPYLSLALADITNVSPQKYNAPVQEKAFHMANDAVQFMVTDPTASLDSATHTERGNRLQEQVRDATYQYILGKIDAKGYEAAMDKWLKDGGQKIMDEYNEQYASLK